VILGQAKWAKYDRAVQAYPQSQVRLGLLNRGALPAPHSIMRGRLFMSRFRYLGMGTQTESALFLRAEY